MDGAGAVGLALADVAVVATPSEEEAGVTPAEEVAGVSLEAGTPTVLEWLPHLVQVVWVEVIRMVDVVVPTSMLVVPPVVCVEVNGHTVVVVSTLN